MGNTNAEMGNTNTERYTEMGNANAEKGKTNTEMSNTNAEMCNTNTEMGNTNAEMGNTNAEMGNTNKATCLCEGPSCSEWQSNEDSWSPVPKCHGHWMFQPYAGPGWRELQDPHIQSARRRR